MTLDTPRAGDTLRDRLRAWIHAQHLQPGMRLPAERQLAAMLGVSRSSLREAIQQLISRGELTSKRGGGTWVSASGEPWAEQQIVEPIRQLLADDPDYRWDILEARHAIEASTAWHAAMRATEADKEKLRLAFDALLKLHDCDDPDLAAQADLRFHLAIAEASHNVVLLHTMRGFFDLLQSSVLHSRQRMYTQPVIFNRLNEQHQALFDAVMAGEAEAARQAAMDHLGFVHTTLKSLHEDEARQARITRLPGQIKENRKENNG
ncbi:transcriptional regulator LldR [Pantoea sp. Mb-10]|uniref:transcriptional regulator LldR n=1 Tax=unclassified Pantoea TaxID=2630326 RepID=UPI001E36624A|nr:MULTISPECIES: transcriptional regulator LldR [unclassified Pantoea]MCE0488997.1 transcriptional regulator LldR [Pantoea sp. Mb-10]MCE0500744.1 transcriptional regulator LldR [Pantoea sp. Pb-8]